MMTTLEHLTDETVLDTLRRWRRGETAATPMLQLHQLGDLDGLGHYTRDALLYDAIDAMVRSELNDQRATAAGVLKKTDKR